MQRRPLLCVALLFVVSALVIGSGALADTPLGATGLKGDPTPVASKLSYQGYLTDGAGQPLTGTHDLVFELHDHATADSMSWSETHTGVTVDDGHVQVMLDVDSSDFNGSALWLGVSVDGTTLTPRQELLPAPYALSLIPGSTIKGGSGHGLIIESGGATGLFAQVDMALDSSAAVSGWNLGGVGDGVRGTSDGNAGVQGIGQGSHAVGVEARGYVAGLSAVGFGDQAPDVILRAGTAPDDLGVISTDPDVITSSMAVRSYMDVTVELDANNDDNGAAFDVRDGEGNSVFTVTEQDGLFAQGDLHLAPGGTISSYGHEMEWIPLTPNDVTPITVPGYCMDGLCAIYVLTDGDSGAVWPGIMMPVHYMQNAASDQWFSGPSMPIGAHQISSGRGTNGDQSEEMIYYSGATDGGGGVIIFDDMLPDESDNVVWTADFHAVPGEITFAEVYIVPVGVPFAPIMPVSVDGGDR